VVFVRAQCNDWTKVRVKAGLRRLLLVTEILVTVAPLTMCLANSVEECHQKSCRLVHALWSFGHSNVLVIFGATI